MVTKRFRFSVSLAAFFVAVLVGSFAFAQSGSRSRPTRPRTSPPRVAPRRQPPRPQAAPNVRPRTSRRRAAPQRFAPQNTALLRTRSGGPRTNGAARATSPPSSSLGASVSVRPSFDAAAARRWQQARRAASSESTASPVVAGGNEALRRWTDTTGQFQTDAVLLAAATDSVRLRKPTGAIVTVPVARLSADDQQYVLQRVNRPGDGVVPDQN